MEVAGTWLGETLLRTITQQAGSTNFFFINPHKLALRYVRMISIQDERPKKNSANAPIEQVNERAIEPRLCHGCVGEFPDLVALDNQYREKGVKIIGISLDKTSDIDSKI